MKTICLFSLSIVLLVSCSKIIGLAYGTNPKVEDNKSQVDYLMNNNIDTSYSYNLNLSMVDSMFTKKYKLDTFLKEGFTPLQLRVYNKNGDFIGGWAVCYANKIKRTHLLDSFPIDMKRLQHIPFNYNLKLSNDLKLIQKGPSIQEIESENSEIVILAFWAESLGRFSHQMMQEINQYANRNPDKKILFIKVNVSNLFSKD